MTVPAFFFYLFSSIAVASAFMVIAGRNPVHSVLWLILTFVNAAGLFLLIGAEFLALILIVVYVGAVAVLFLFVVMMLDVDFAELRAGFIKNAPIGLIVGGAVLAELLALVVYRGVDATTAAAPKGAAVPSGISNTEALGLIVYTKYVYFFQAAGLILLVAMVGAIVLTLQHRTAVRRQSIAAQVARSPATALAVVKVAPGETGMPAAAEKGQK